MNEEAGAAPGRAAWTDPGGDGRLLLVVPLPGLTRALPRLAQLECPAPFVPLLDPFLAEPDAGAISELTRLFADVVPFTTELDDLSEFPGGPAYLSPRPSAPFRRLAGEVAHRFPEAGHHPTSFTDLPHVRVPRHRGETLEELRTALSPWLPSATRADEAALWWCPGRRQGTAADGDGEPGPSSDPASVGARVVATFPFGTSAA